MQFLSARSKQNFSAGSPIFQIFWTYTLDKGWGSPNDPKTLRGSPVGGGGGSEISEASNFFKQKCPICFIELVEVSILVEKI